MDKIYRHGPDVNVALAVAARRASRDVPASLAAPAAPAEAPAPVPEAAPAGWRAQLKRSLRIPVRFMFRLLRPFIRPITFRARRYLAAEVQHDLLRYHVAAQEASERVTAELLREMQASRALLRQELAATQQLAALEQRQAFEARIMRMEDQHTHGVLPKIAQLATQLGNLPALSALSAQLDTLAAQVGAALAPRLDTLEQYGYASARRVIIQCGPERVLIKAEPGYVLCPVSDLSIIVGLADTGDLERGTRLLIERLIRPGDVFVDVGANLGIHTLAAARALRGQGKIVAFEPFPTTCELLAETIRINGYAGLTEIHQAAVSDHAGEQALHLGKSSGHHSLYALAQQDATGAAPVQVRTVRLDEVLAPALPVTLIKIDAEGAELEVLRSASATLAANPDLGLIVEFGVSHLTRNGHDASAWLGEFAALGLEYRAIDPDSGRLEQWSQAQLTAVDSINLLFARPGAALWERARTP